MDDTAGRVTDATDRAASAATEKARELADTAGQTAQQAMDYTREAASRVGGRARRNPVPLVLLGLCAAWVIARRAARGRGERMRREEREYGTTDWTSSEESGEQSVERGWGHAREYVSGASSSMRQMVRRRGSQFQNMVQDNPLLVGLGALILGLAFGMAVPETEAEKQWMGEARDTVVGRARDMARNAANQVQDAAGTIAGAAGEIAGRAQS